MILRFWAIKHQNPLYGLSTKFAVWNRPVELMDCAKFLEVDLRGSILWGSKFHRSH